ncbi:keratin, type I cytoskeletal 10-like [Episyrphus balteatus]|uniref:keratin, type I cytoskeletal 10-like n=1 Tax=Episyrphus balteatus TaxID=286459 RepID=UPI002485C2B6|nr:keratin, type I cytoskeletal 10-like [Episyrphus balteatus]
MRSFIIFGFLAAAVSAGVLPGYNYGPGVSGVRQQVSHVSGISGNLIGQGSSSYSSGGLISSGSGISSSSSGGSLISSGGFGSSSGNGFISSGGYGSSSGSGLYGSSSSGIISSGNYKQAGNTLNIGFDALDSVPQTVEYSKQFYNFEAPEEAHEEGQVTRQLSNVLKKNLQVVFIKAPENNAATNAALQLAKQAIEQRTAIYVLTKQQDGAHLVGQLQQIQENVQTKPEVKFVKYRTNEDVLRAKAEIQAQYDNFGGASENYDGGVAPVLNYASPGSPSQIILGGSSSGSSYGSGSSFGSGSSIGSGSSFGSGSTQFIGGASKYQSGSSIGSGSTQLIGVGSLGSSSSNIGSSTYSSSSSKTGSSTFTAGTSYLPPIVAKK